MPKATAKSKGNGKEVDAEGGQAPRRPIGQGYSAQAVGTAMRRSTTRQRSEARCGDGEKSGQEA